MHFGYFNGKLQHKDTLIYHTYSEHNMHNLLSYNYLKVWMYILTTPNNPNNLNALTILTILMCYPSNPENPNVLAPKSKQSWWGLRKYLYLEAIPNYANTIFTAW